MLAALLSALCGCKSAPTPVPYAREYPVDVTRVPKTLDIQVFRRTYTIDFTNTTAREFGPSTLWLNRRFSYPITGVALAEQVEIPLKQFKDEFSDQFRGGGFFASEAPDTLVMAELETADENGATVMYGFTVVRGTPEN